MAEQQFARGIWSGFAPTERPFGTPNGMDDNLRLIDDHLALYTLAAPVATGTLLPTSVRPGAGQLFADGGFAVFNGGTWKLYGAILGLRAFELLTGTHYLCTGAGWQAVTDKTERAYLSLAVMQADHSLPPGSQGVVTNDPAHTDASPVNGWYTWSGSAWVRNAFQPANQADLADIKNDVETIGHALTDLSDNALQHRGDIATGALIDHTLAGLYYLSKNAIPPDLPPHSVPTYGGLVENYFITIDGGFVAQKFRQMNSLKTAWIREINIKNKTATEWMTLDSSGYYGLLNDADDLNAASLNSLIGTYIYTAKPINSPPDAPSSGIFRAILAGSYVYQEVISIIDPLQTWFRIVRPNNNAFGSWIKNTKFNYGERGIIESGAIGDRLEQGIFRISSAVALTDMPTKMQLNSAWLVENRDATGDGRYVHQVLRNVVSPKMAFIRLVDRTGIGKFFWEKMDISEYYGTIDSTTDLNNSSIYELLGAFVYTAKPINSPIDAPNSGLFRAQRYGSFVVQEIFPLDRVDVSWARIARPGTGVFYEWNQRRYSGSGGGSGSGSGVNRRWVFFGDSITESGDYPEIVAENIGFEVIKAGFGGCRMGKHSIPAYDPMCMYRLAECIGTGNFQPLIDGAQVLYAEFGDDNRVQAAAVANANWQTIDGVVIFFGTNDFGGNLPMGTNTDTGGETFKGAINRTIKYLIDAYPRLNILFVTPFFRSRGPLGNDKDSDNYPNSIGMFLRDYCQAIKEIGSLYHIPVFDLHSTSGINTTTAPMMIPDGLHPSKGFGYARVAERIGASIRGTFYA
jgi:lysophospholipase L1-like esterase